MGFLVVQVAAEGERTWQIRPADVRVLLLLAAASSLLYAAGVVLNDVFDLEIDRHERPERPIPSGRISCTRRARRLGCCWPRAWRWHGSWRFTRDAPRSGRRRTPRLKTAKSSTTASRPRPWRASPGASAFAPGLIGALLAAAIVLYDLGLKRTPLGPVGMGACRMLNVLLGMSVLAGPFRPEHFLIAGGIGVYVAGIAWLARNETGRCDRRQILAAVLVMAAGIAMLAWLPRWKASARGPVLLVLVHGALGRDDPLAVVVRRHRARSAARANGRHPGHPVDYHAGRGRVLRRAKPLALGRRDPRPVDPGDVPRPLAGEHVKNKGEGGGRKAEGSRMEPNLRALRPPPFLSPFPLPPSAFCCYDSCIGQSSLNPCCHHADCKPTLRRSDRTAAKRASWTRRSAGSKPSWPPIPTSPWRMPG